jgi:hypothetical protein
MRSRTRVIAAVAIAAALAAGGAGAAIASTTATKPGAPPAAGSASGKPAAGSDLGGQPGGSAAASAKAASAKSAGEQTAPGPGADALSAAVAKELHVSAARAATALRPLLAGGMIDSSSQEFAAAARSLGVSPQQLSAALAQAKQSVAGGK